ncbi:MAG: Stk1 family PASTA domain-containing Ser/Thr kinase [Candidatus Limiplasma sp.]|nr:Stk1 family PASTA domain-containing Ser/Thr kinase [Candidatus Limiplasma sp.]
MMKGMVFAERYKLVDFIGQGGMSLVYRAVDIRTGHSVAIKILKAEYNSDKEFLERFQREAQAASLMSHHNIVNLLDVGVEGEFRYLVLEYVSGSTLKDIIQQRGHLNTNTAVQIAVRILSALQHAHDNGIIHRDIKPQNILVNADGHIKVADFGIARMTNAFTISKGDTVVGSVHYSSPEQATGNVVEATSDIYSTGIVLYEMLTGRVPFLGDTPVSVAMQHVNATPPPITDYNPDVPPAVVNVIMRALEKSPKKRYQSAREMADALQKARDGKEEASPSPLPDRPNPQPGGPARRPSSPTRSGAQTSRHPPVRRRKRSTVALTILTGMLVFIALIVGVVSVIQTVTDSAVAPDVTGATVEEAMALVKRAGLNWQQINVNHDVIAAGTVISQTPEADAEMRKGDSVVATVSLGPTRLLTPDVMGLSRTDAAARLKEKGLSMVVLKSPSAEPVDTVIAQNPARDEPCSQGQEIEVTISGGSTLVPDLSGQVYEDALQLIKENNLTAGKVEYGDTASEDQIGKVLAQSPAAGTMAVLDAQVSLTVGAKSKAYHADMEVEVPAVSQSVPLRVTLVEGDTEVEQYSGMTNAGSAYSIIVPVSSNQSGMLVCRAYLNGQLTAEREVELQ